MDRPGRDGVVLLFLFLLGLVFFAANANLQLAADDVAWLQGKVATVFDEYRQIPRLFFVSLHALFGLNAVAALSMIFFFHLLNSLLLYHLGRTLLADSTAALVAVAVFLINPITLNTLTWISCFSYVLGTTLALLALLAFCRGSQQGARSRLFWSAVAWLCFVAGLFCTHEILFLPAIFVILGWLQGDLRQGTGLFVAGMAFALLINACVYDFGRYGIKASGLFSFGFAQAYTSSGFSSGLALSLAYPLSFFVKPLDFLRVCFSEPLRWGLTATLLAVGVLFYRNDRSWRLNLALLFSFLALITPYIIRLYLTPDTVNYHISYVLSGRVFYLPFTAVALMLGKLAAELCRPIKGQRWAWLVLLLPLMAYGHALRLYDKADFLGLNVARGSSQVMPPRWNPYVGQHPAWLLLVGLAVMLTAIIRLQAVANRPRDAR